MKELVGGFRSVESGGGDVAPANRAATPDNCAVKGHRQGGKQLLPSFRSSQDYVPVRTSEFALASLTRVRLLCSADDGRTGLCGCVYWLDVNIKVNNEPKNIFYYLSEFAEAIRFGKVAGLLTRPDDLRLRPQTTRVELARLRQLRALLKRIFQKRLCGQAPSNMDLGRLSADLAEVARATRPIAATRTRQSSQIPVIREISAENAGDALLRLRIVEAAAALLVSDAALRVKSCPACGWFFLDVNKNRSRRWCSMDACGAVAKARRYYRRLKDRAGSLTRAAGHTSSRTLPSAGSAAAPAKWTA